MDVEKDWFLNASALLRFVNNSVDPLMLLIVGMVGNIGLETR
ncbi:hypothetical protein [Nitrospira sp. Nam74]